jgi:hypothetical protein
MTRLLFVLGLLVLTTPADAVPTWRLLSGLWAPFYWSYAGIESEGQGRIYHTWNGQTWLFNPGDERLGRATAQPPVARPLMV